MAHKDVDPATSRILIVDDEPSILSFVEQAMRMAGYQTLTASSGPAAIALCESKGLPDLLLTDFKMPGMDGDALAARLRQREPDLKVLYLTGFADQLFDDRGGTLWRDEAFLEKPCTVDGLLEAVAMLLSDSDANYQDRV
jgi:two-component system, cell cycle sensor histidine kinase and response regulator CckA